MKAHILSTLVLALFAFMAGGSVDDSGDSSSTPSVPAKHTYDYEGSYSTESLFGDMVKLKFEVKIFNLSDSETMKINIWDTVSYTIDGNEYSLSGMPEDSAGNGIETTIAPGQSKTVYYSDLRNGGVSGTIGFSYEYGGAGWAQANR